MAEMSRRMLLQRAAVGVGGIGAFGGLSALLAACGSSDDEGGSTGTAAAEGGGGDVSMPRVGMSSALQPSYVVAMAGPLSYGARFGLRGSRDDFVMFDSSATLSQSALSGDVPVIGQSSMAQLILVDRGLPFKVFAPFNDLDDFVIAARRQITRLDQLLDPANVVAVDEPGGAGEANMDAMLVSGGADFLSREIPKKVVIGSSGDRTSALASGDCVATSIHLLQARDVRNELGEEINVLATLYEDNPAYIMQLYAARTDWLDDNLDSAAAFCASVIEANRALTPSYDEFKRAVDTYVIEPPDERDLRELHALIERYEYWALDGGLQREKIEAMVELGLREGNLRRELAYEDVVDPRPLEMALEMLG